MLLQEGALLRAFGPLPAQKGHIGQLIGDVVLHQLGGICVDAYSVGGIEGLYPLPRVLHHQPLGAGVHRFVGKGRAPLGAAGPKEYPGKIHGQRIQSVLCAGAQPALQGAVARLQLRLGAGLGKGHAAQPLQQGGVHLLPVQAGEQAVQPFPGGVQLRMCHPLRPPFAVSSSWGSASTHLSRRRM